MRSVATSNIPHTVLYDLAKDKQKDVLKRINMSPHIHLLSDFAKDKSILEIMYRTHILEKMVWESIKIPPEIMYFLRLRLNYKPIIMKTLKRIWDK